MEVAEIHQPGAQLALHIVFEQHVVRHNDRRSPAHLAAFVKSEIEKWRGPVDASGAISD